MTEYYLNPEEIKHYAYMLKNGYQHKVVNVERDYVVFPVLNKEYIGIAWPGAIEADSQVIFVHNQSLQDSILPQLDGVIKVLLFPILVHKDEAKNAE